MNFNVLRYAVTVAEERSFTKAARRLAVSQPSLSQGIQSLEQRLGATLFNRKNNPITLTQAGEIYVEWAKNVLLSQSQLSRQLSTVADASRSRLTVGAPPHLSALLLPDAVQRFAREQPDCDLNLVEESSGVLHERLNRGELDLMIGAPHGDSTRFSSTLVLRERVLLAAPAGWGLAGDELPELPYPQVHLSDLRDKPFLTVRPDRISGQILLGLCEQENFVPRCEVECQRSATAHALASRGMGLAILPELTVRLGGALPEVAYFCLTGDPYLDLCIVTRIGGISVWAAAFSDIFMTLYAEKSPVLAR